MKKGLETVEMFRSFLHLEERKSVSLSRFNFESIFGVRAPRLKLVKFPAARNPTAAALFRLAALKSGQDLTDPVQAVLFDVGRNVVEVERKNLVLVFQRLVGKVLKLANRKLKIVTAIL